MEDGGQRIEDRGQEIKLMEKVHFNFEDLKVYQKALDFADHVYSLTAKFPKHEIYGLSSQFNRAAVSIALNTSEGSGNTDAQFHKYLQIADDSLRECLTCSTISLRRGYISEEENQKSRLLLLEIFKMIKSLQKYLKSKRKSTVHRPLPTLLILNTNYSLLNTNHP